MPPPESIQPDPDLQKGDKCQYYYYENVTDPTQKKLITQTLSAGARCGFNQDPSAVCMLRIGDPEYQSYK